MGAAVLGAAAWGGVAAHAQCPFDFAAVVNYPSDVQPVSLVVADFNCDGVPDIAVANVGSNSVSILLGVGPSNPGTFQAPVSYPVGAFPRCLAFGDFNGDGRPDLAVANYNSNTVSVLLAYPNGTFQPAVNYAAGFNPHGVAVGDFNGDGVPDLAVVNKIGGNVSILLGNPAGIFGTAVNYATNGNPTNVVVADFNADGKADLAVTNSGNNTIAVLLGSGTGGFLPAINYAVGTGPLFLAVGDFNHDGRPDLAVANYDSNNVSILLGNGVGAFAPVVNYATGANPTAVAIADFNADGSPDLAVSSHASAAVTFLRNNGSGAFQTVVSEVVGTGPYCIAAGDFNADGKPDVAVANFDSGNVSVLLGNFNPSTFLPAVNYDVGLLSFPTSVAVGDFNLIPDGVPDLVLTTADLGLGGRASVRIYFGSANGTFNGAPQAAALGGNDPTCVAVGDFNGDGRPDLAVTIRDRNNVSILLGNPQSFFDAPVNYAVGSGPSSIAIGDFNGDGRPDLAVTNSDSNTVSVLLANGPPNSGTFRAAVNYPVGAHPSAVAVGDFDGDGRPDLAVANFGGQGVSILIGNVDGTFRGAANYIAGNLTSIAVGDFNGDGRPDLAVPHFTLLTSSPLAILLNNAPPLAGTFQTTGTSRADGTAIAAGDVNGDGRPDLAVANDIRVSILLANGPPNAGTFQARADYPTPAGAGAVAMADFNADGKLDVVVANREGHSFSILLNTTGPQSYPAPTIIQQPRASQFVQAGRTAALSVAADGHGRPFTYQWRKNGALLVNGGRISGASSPTLIITQAVPGDTAQYDVQVLATGCFGSTLVTTSTPGTITVTGGTPACTADFNHDGAVNSQDFFDFLTAFFAGC